MHFPGSLGSQQPWGCLVARANLVTCRGAPRGVSWAGLSPEVTRALVPLSVCREFPRGLSFQGSVALPHGPHLAPCTRLPCNRTRRDSTPSVSRARLSPPTPSSSPSPGLGASVSMGHPEIPGNSTTQGPAISGMGRAHLLFLCCPPSSSWTRSGSNKCVATAL